MIRYVFLFGCSYYNLYNVFKFKLEHAFCHKKNEIWIMPDCILFAKTSFLVISTPILKSWKHIFSLKTSYQLLVFLMSKRRVWLPTRYGNTRGLTSHLCLMLNLFIKNSYSYGETSYVKFQIRWNYSLEVHFVKLERLGLKKTIKFVKQQSK